METSSDEELILQFKTANARLREQIFLVLFNRYNAKIITRARSYLNNTEDAEEVAQNAWVGIVRSLEKGLTLNEGSFQRWLHGVVHNKIIDCYRKRNKLLTLEHVPHAKHDLVMENEMKEILSLCIAKFSRKYQNILCMTLVPESSDKWYNVQLTSEMVQQLLQEICVWEISERFRESTAMLTKRLSSLLKESLPENTVKVQRYRAIKMLQECLRNYE